MVSRAGRLREQALEKPAVPPALALTDPAGTAAAIGALPGMTVERTIHCDKGPEPVSVFHLRIDPPQDFASLGYPVEYASLVVTSRVLVYPRGSSAVRGRRFKHRNSTGDLCLFYARDDRALRWEPSDGLGPLLAIAQRHFAAEEFNRREKRWPFEDAPHYEPPSGTHPIRDLNLRKELRAWRRAS